MKKLKLDYTNINIELYTQEGNKRKHPMKFVSSGCKYFFCAQHLFIDLTPKERSFFDHICEQMDTDNGIMINSDLKNAYIHFMEAIFKGELKLTTAILDKAIAKFKQLKLILHLSSGAAYYLVNPRYVFKGKEVDRKKLLIKVIKERMDAGLPIDALINKPIEDFNSGSVLKSKKSTVK